MGDPHIGETFDDKLIWVCEWDEYVGCTFNRCEFRKAAGTNSFKFYDCSFVHCEFEAGLL